MQNHENTNTLADKFRTRGGTTVVVSFGLSPDFYFSDATFI